jgi:hypothetical protein
MVVALVTALHLVLLYSMAEGKIVSTLFAAGPHLPFSSFVLAIAFLAVRLTAIVVLPGYVLYRLARVVVLWRDTQARLQVDGTTEP